MDGRYTSHDVSQVTVITITTIVLLAVNHVVFK